MEFLGNSLLHMKKLLTVKKPERFNLKPKKTKKPTLFTRFGKETPGFRSERHKLLKLMGNIPLGEEFKGTVLLSFPTCPYWTLRGSTTSHRAFVLPA